MGAGVWSKTLVAPCLHQGSDHARCNSFTPHLYNLSTYRKTRIVLFLMLLNQFNYVSVLRVRVMRNCWFRYVISFLSRSLISRSYNQQAQLFFISSVTRKLPMATLCFKLINCSIITHFHLYSQKMKLKHPHCTKLFVKMMIDAFFIQVIKIK